MTPEEQQKKSELEKQINEEFSLLQQNLSDLKKNIQSETDETKKQEKSKKIQEMESELGDIKVGKERVERMTTLQEQELLSLKDRMESIKNTIQEINGEVNNLANEIIESNKKSETPETYKLLEGSETHSRLLNIISSNPKNFKQLEGNSPQEKLESLFRKIRGNVVQFLKNKLGDSPECDRAIRNTIAPALERNAMEMLKTQGNESNTEMLNGMNKISLNSINKLLTGVLSFADNKKESFDKFNQWVNAIDYLAVSIQNGSLKDLNKSAVMTNPIEFKNYLNNPVFNPKDQNGNGVSFSPYNPISENIFKIDENQNFEFGITPQDQQSILNEIGNIKVVDSPKTTELIVKMMDKSTKFLNKKNKLQEGANKILNGLNSVSGITKIIGIDLVGEITKSPEKRSFAYKIFDFICKLIGFTGGIEGIVKTWRLDRLQLDNQKKNNIKLIYEKFKEKGIANKDITISDQATCEQILQEFELTDLDKNSPSTRGDFLCLAIAENIDLNLVSPSMVKEVMGNNYISEYVGADGKKQTKIMTEKFGDNEKKQLAYNHIKKMKEHLKGNYNNLTDFFKNVHSVDDISIAMTTALYSSKDDVIEGMKAKVFLPESYGVVRSNETVRSDVAIKDTSTGGENLDSAESSDKQKVSEKWIYDKAKEYGITDNRQIAYVLSTIKGESGFKNQKEIGGENKSYGKVDATTGKAYYGRGFIQITHKSNYQIYSQIIKDSGKDFKDNNGNIIKGSEIDLVNNPDIILQSNDLAAFIAMDWMKNGGPSRQDTKRLDHYINDNKQDYYNARIIINGMSSNPKGYADTAQTYLDKLGKGSLNSPTESNELYIGPELLAHNKDEIGGLGNSIMNGFQGLDKKSNFPNMDGVVSKNTKSHPHKFNSKADVTSYKAAHPSVKSFMFYFGENSQDNTQTLSDIKKWSEWLKDEGIQPVLCTCIGEDKHSRLPSLNSDLLALGQKNNWPVFNFSKAYKDGSIKIGSDGIHPSSYAPMTDIINTRLSKA